jgi:hypothetical protein
MQALKILLLLLLFSCAATGQDNLRHFELGTTILTVNGESDLGEARQKPVFEFINGLFFRYTKQRLGFRALTSYTQYHQVPYGFSSFPTLIDKAGDHQHYKDLKLGIGGQFALVPKNRLYSFVDVIYNNIYSAGRPFTECPTPDAIAYTSITINGIDTHFGFRFSFPLFKHFKISPEGCYGFFKGQRNSYRKSMWGGESWFSTDKISNGQIFLKVHLTYEF